MQSTQGETACSSSLVQHLPLLHSIEPRKIRLPSPTAEKEFAEAVAREREALRKEKFLHRHLRIGLLRAALFLSRMAIRLEDQLYP